MSLCYNNLQMNRKLQTKEVIAAMKRNRVIALILAAIVFLVMAFSLCVVAAEAGHDCHGEDCPVCKLVAVCENNIRGMSLILVLVALIVSLALLRVCVREARIGFCRSQTPVLLKVKLTN